jgi:hypothetical protein
MAGMESNGGITFLGQVQLVATKTCKDLSKVCRVTIETTEQIAGFLEKIDAETNVIVAIRPE